MTIACVSTKPTMRAIAIPEEILRCLTSS
jgi:hypothetical protein